WSRRTCHCRRGCHSRPHRMRPPREAKIPPPRFERFSRNVSFGGGLPAPNRRLRKPYTGTGTPSTRRREEPRAHPFRRAPPPKRFKRDGDLGVGEGEGVTRRIVPIVVLALLGIGGYVAYRLYERHKASEPLEWSGTIEAWTMDVGSRVGGRVKEVLVREGDQVKANQPLLILETG